MDPLAGHASFLIIGELNRWPFLCRIPSTIAPLACQHLSPDVPPPPVPLLPPGSTCSRSCRCGTPNHPGLALTGRSLASRGTSGYVYLCWDRRMGREVAIKLVPRFDGNFDAKVITREVCAAFRDLFTSCLRPVAAVHERMCHQAASHIHCSPFQRHRRTRSFHVVLLQQRRHQREVRALEAPVARSASAGAQLARHMAAASDGTVALC